MKDDPKPPDWMTVFHSNKYGEEHKYSLRTLDSMAEILTVIINVLSEISEQEKKSNG